MRGLSRLHSASGGGTHVASSPPIAAMSVSWATTRSATSESSATMRTAPADDAVVTVTLARPNRRSKRSAFGVDGLHPGYRRDAAFLHQPSRARVHRVGTDVPPVDAEPPQRNHTDEHQDADRRGAAAAACSHHMRWSMTNHTTWASASTAHGINAERPHQRRLAARRIRGVLKVHAFTRFTTSRDSGTDSPRTAQCPHRPPRNQVRHIGCRYDGGIPPRFAPHRRSQRRNRTPAHCATSRCARHRAARSAVSSWFRSVDGRFIGAAGLRPMCSMTDVCVPAVPAVRITRGLVTERFIRRTVFTTGPTCHRMPAIRSPNNTTPHRPAFR